MARSQVEVVLQWLQRSTILNAASGVLTAPPPILSITKQCDVRSSAARAASSVAREEHMGAGQAELMAEEVPVGREGTEGTAAWAERWEGRAEQQEAAWAVVNFSICAEHAHDLLSEHVLLPLHCRHLLTCGDPHLINLHHAGDNFGRSPHLNTVHRVQDLR